MPEVCEVCLTSQYLESCVGDSITSIKIVHGRYLKTPIKGLNKLTFPLKIINIDTKGKFMWMTLMHNNNTYYMLNTFGLTGKWFLEELNSTRVKFRLKSDKEKYNLYFDDARNFGTIEFTDDIEILNKKLNKLAPDLLKTDYTEKNIEDRLDAMKTSKRTIVDILMSQDEGKGIGSGLGNYLTPEILYRAKISPYRTVSSLSSADIARLTKAIKHTLRLCYITNTTHYIEHLKKFLEKHNTKKFPNYRSDVDIGNEVFEFKVYGKKFDAKGNEILRDEIIKGRNMYWCPDVQH